MSISKRISQLRKMEELTQNSFGDRLGVSHVSVSKWESGTTVPDERSIKAICREFRVNYSWLVHGIGDMYIPESDSLIEEICEEYGMVDPDEKQVMYMYLSMPHDLRMEFLDVVKKVLKVYRDESGNSKTGST